MQFSDVSGKSGIVEDIDFRAKTDSTSYPLADKTRNINNRMNEVAAIIMSSDGRWEWDDSNNNDLPIGTTNLIDQQQDYQISGATVLKIDRVEVLDANGAYYLLYSISEKNVTDQAMTEFQKTPGRPLYYDKKGDSIFLYPKPSASSVTLSAGLKVYFQRLPSYFVTTDTTKTPGFNPLFHKYLSIGAAIDYCDANDMNDRLRKLEAKLAKVADDIVQFYSSRIHDEHVHMSVASGGNYGEEDGYGKGERTPSDKVAYY